MNITRRIHLNPQSKGNLGRSFELEFRAAWLDRLGVTWNGSDLDDRHRTFATRHRDLVRSYQLGDEYESKTELLTLFRRVLKDATPVHVIDTPAQADALILSALDQFQVLDVCAEQNIRLTFFLFPSDERESLNNLGQLFLYAGDRADYVIVHNPTRSRGDLFKGSPFEAQLIEFGAKSITLPPVTPTTVRAIERAEAKVRRSLSFAEVSQVEVGHLQRLLAGEVQWAMQSMFRQYDAIADLLLPTDLVRNDPPTTVAESSRAWNQSYEQTTSAKTGELKTIVADQLSESEKVAQRIHIEIDGGAEKWNSAKIDFERVTKRLMQLCADLQGRSWCRHWVLMILLLIATFVAGYAIGQL